MCESQPFHLSAHYTALTLPFVFFLLQRERGDSLSLWSSHLTLFRLHILWKSLNICWSVSELDGSWDPLWVHPHGCNWHFSFVSMDEEIISVNLYHSFYQFICLSYLFIIFLFVNDAEELEVQLSFDFGCLQALYLKESSSVDYGTSLSEFSTNLQNVLRSRPTKLHFCQRTRRVPFFLGSH